MNVQVASTMARCRVLGPGVRTVIWVAGCSLRCRECIVPEWLDPAAGTTWQSHDLAAWVAAQGTDGLTLSGGEPFEQAAALVRVIDLVRADRPDLSVVAFSGRTLSRLGRGTRDQRGLLARVDVLIDGPYVPGRHIDARLRASSNQGLHLLTARVSEQQLGDREVSSGVEVTLDDEGGFSVVGVPPTRGFRPSFEAGVRQAPDVVGGEAPR